VRVAAVLLAAGASRRLGRPKQLVRLAGRSLVRRAAEAALGAGCAPLFAVVGAHADEVLRELEPLAAVPVRNAGWQEGIASSIRAGVAAAEAAAPGCDGALLLLVDQPRVDAELLRRLLARFGAGRGALPVASAYGGGRGVPAVFPRASFAALAALRGDRGAKALLEAPGAEVLEVPFPDGELDLDEPADLLALESGAPTRAARRPRPGTP
jgi:CTP:molybdopterin cytidylyltransferase MocA